MSSVCNEVIINVSQNFFTVNNYVHLLRNFCQNQLNKQNEAKTCGIFKGFLSGLAQSKC